MKRLTLLKKVLLKNGRKKQHFKKHPLIKHVRFFRGLKKASQQGGGSLKRILKKAKNNEMNAIYNSFYNLLRGNIDIPERERTYIKKHGAFIRKLASKRVLAKNKRKLLIKQAGGFLPALIGALVPALISTITSFAR